ncbi:MAG TPA: peptidoglycan-binding domain-containing protein, partial [Myxococcota bacterium]|nr:peptidoglycan-binding domain-containing protein [Myxococcota bacterium]
LVDTWSSRELKQLMYVTERRIRYGSAGVLQPAALYFKSGSLYSCVPEEGFVCRKYHGNRRNYMNSVAIIESPAGQNRLFYSVAVLSNVLRKNSAEDHRALAQAIHDLLLADHPPKALAAGERAPATSYGEGFIGYEQERRAMQLRLDTQQALLALGYEIGEIDGVIGPNTRAAIRRFQSAAGEQGDAEVSEALLAKLRAAIESRGASRPAASPAP